MSPFGLRRIPDERDSSNVILFMSFDAAKVQRFLLSRKQFFQIVCDNSCFVDSYQRIMGKKSKPDKNVLSSEAGCQSLTFFVR